NKRMTGNRPKKTARHDPVLESAREMYAGLMANSPEEGAQLRAELAEAQRRKPYIVADDGRIKLNPNASFGAQAAFAGKAAGASALERARAQAEQAQRQADSLQTRVYELEAQARGLEVETDESDNVFEDLSEDTGDTTMSSQYGPRMGDAYAD